MTRHLANKYPKSEASVSDICYWETIHGKSFSEGAGVDNKTGKSFAGTDKTDESFSRTPCINCERTPRTLAAPATARWEMKCRPQL